MQIFHLTDYVVCYNISVLTVESVVVTIYLQKMTLRRYSIYNLRAANQSLIRLNRFVI